MVLSLSLSLFVYMFIAACSYLAQAMRVAECAAVCISEELCIAGGAAIV